MQQQERAHREERSKLLEEVQRLREEKEEQQNLLAQSLVLSEDARVEARLKHEIRRLTRENLVGHSASYRLSQPGPSAPAKALRSASVSSSFCPDVSFFFYLHAGSRGAAGGAGQSDSQAKKTARPLREKGGRV